MKQNLNIFCGQINPTVGNTRGNRKIIQDIYTQGQEKSADIVFLPECALSGYYPEDLLLRPDYIEELAEAAEHIAAQTNEVALAFGTPWFEDGNLYNSILFCRNGEVEQTFHKTELPNYGVFDEKRHFHAGSNYKTIELNNIKIGFPICEDLWHPQVCAAYKEQGAQLLLCANASPYEAGKQATRVELAEERALENDVPILYLNLSGGQDELIFDGASFTVNPSEAPSNIQPNWKEKNFPIQIKLNQIDKYYIEKDNSTFQKDDFTTLYEGLKVSIRDYMAKTGFNKCVLGMSGGLDSALVATLAADALGSENVMAVMMPSPYTSEESINDAVECCKNLGIKIHNSHIESGMKAYEDMFLEALGEVPRGVTAENIQSRIRGQILMAISNQTGALLLTTGNKSEMAVGYATLYGDMCGGFNPLKDIYKTDAFKMAEWRNTISTAIPENILKKPPSAELKPNQQDTDSLPPYAMLDAILKHLVEDKMSVSDIAEKGFAKEQVNYIAHLLRISEYKRRQAAPGPKVSSCAFERDWRMPISGKYQY